MNIRFNIDKKKDKALIFIIYNIPKGRRFKMSTGISIDPMDWCQVSMRVKDSHPHAHLYNISLANFEMLLKDQLAKAKAGLYIPTPQAIKKSLQNYIISLDPSDDNGRYSMKSYIDRIYTLLSSVDSLKEAYYLVEDEWNDAGVMVFPNYEAFRVGKSRFLRKQKSGKVRAV